MLPLPSRLGVGFQNGRGRVYGIDHFVIIKVLVGVAIGRPVGDRPRVGDRGVGFAMDDIMELLLEVFPVRP